MQRKLLQLLVIVGLINMLSVFVHAQENDAVFAFWANRDGDTEIYVMNADGSTQQLTNNSVWDGEPQWSPDGSQIVFGSEQDGGGDTEIFVMDADGSNVQQLTQNDASDRSPIWSPDGTQIVFESRRDGDSEIFVMNADGSDVQQLTQNEDSDGSPMWSPDGTQIVFVSRRDGDAEIFVMNADGSDVQQLTQNDEIDVNPAWSPDASQIAFESWVNHNGDIFVMNVDGSDIQQLTDHEEDDENPAWSPDGTQIGFHSDRSGDDDIYVMNADGSDVQLMTADGWDIAWSPNASADAVQPIEATAISSPTESPSNCTRNAVGWCEYTSSTGGFTFSYPPHWTSLRQFSNGPVTVSDDPSAICTDTISNTVGIAVTIVVMELDFDANPTAILQALNENASLGITDLHSESFGAKPAAYGNLSGFANHRLVLFDLGGTNLALVTVCTLTGTTMDFEFDTVEQVITTITLR